MNTRIDSRRLDLDWIRIGAFALLIGYHVGMYYVTWGWHIKSAFASDAIEPLMLAVNPWRLSLLFFVSGCATAFLLGKVPRGGLARLAGQRSKFLLVPLVFGMLVIVPPQSYLEVVDKLGFGQGYLAFMARYLAADHSFCRAAGECLVLPTWNHLWFVVYLWIYTMIVIGARAIGTGERFVQLARSALGGWRLFVVPWLLLALARAVLLPRFGSTHALVGDWYNHAQYFLVFLIGYALARDEAAWNWLVAKRWPLLVTAVCAYASVIAYSTSFSDASPPPDALRTAMRVVYALLQWSALLSVAGWARRLLGSVRDTPARAYFTDAVFCYYIVHQTAIILVAHALKPAGLHPAVEGTLLILSTVAICAVSYELARRSALLRPLFGIRGRRISLPIPVVSRQAAGVSS